MKATSKDRQLVSDLERADHNLAEADKRWENTAEYFMLRAIFFQLRHLTSVIEMRNDA